MRVGYWLYWLDRLDWVSDFVICVDKMNEILHAKIWGKNCFNAGSKKLVNKRWKSNMKLGFFRGRNIEKSDDVMNRKNNKAESPKQSEKKKQQEGWREVGRNIIESNYYEILIVALTFVALFMEDVETLMLTGTFRHTDTYGWLSLREVRPFRRMSILS